MFGDCRFAFAVFAASAPRVVSLSPALDDAADVDATSVEKRASTSARLQKSMASQLRLPGGDLLPEPDRKGAQSEVVLFLNPSNGRSIC